MDSDIGADRQFALPPAISGALKQAPLGVAVFDRDMRYLAVSSRFLTDLGLPSDMNVVGRSHSEVFPDSPAQWRDVFARALESGAQQRLGADPDFRGDGRRPWTRWSLHPWRGADGGVGGLVLYGEPAAPEGEARARLEAAEARYRAVFDQAAMGVARVAPDGALLEVNDRFCTMMGYTRAELKALRFQDITHPADLNTNLAYTRALLAGEIETYSMEKRYVTRSGEVFWNNLTVSLVCDAEGRPDYFISIVEDIAARKSAEAAQQRYQDRLRLLVNELNHRVKNTLATVQSMASQTLRGATDPGLVYEKLEARLLGLSRAHDLLTREHWHGAELGEIAKRALAPFETPAAAIIVGGPAIWLPPGPALTMALIFHELATNAVKYGALSNPEGQVELSWSVVDDDDWVLTWSERGGPPPAPPTRKGFGSRLIERGLQGDLRGTATIAYAPAGLIWTMRARLPAAADAVFGET